MKHTITLEAFDIRVAIENYVRLCYQDLTKGMVVRVSVDVKQAVTVTLEPNNVRED